MHQNNAMHEDIAATKTPQLQSFGGMKNIRRYLVAVPGSCYSTLDKQNFRNNHIQEN